MQEFYQSQVQEINWQHPRFENEKEDDPLSKKLAELRVEVKKRDVLRKFEEL